MEWTLRTVVVMVLLVVGFLVVVVFIAAAGSGSHDMLASIQEFFMGIIYSGNTPT